MLNINNKFILRFVKCTYTRSKMFYRIRKFSNIYFSQQLLFRTMTSHDKIQVVLNEGTIVGAEEALPNGGYYYSYKGIPYAEPPLGKLRFEDPIPLSKFSENILDCTIERDVSHHKDIITSVLIGSEDCLHLNVYSPLSTKNVCNEKPLPVMVFIHGGAFLTGSGNSEYYSPEYLVQENVLVVTLNYRLGALGFLCLPDAGISGNAGLKDQLIALKWINENISTFGGDKNNVTLFGESAGAACVNLHLLTDKSRKYFHKAICQSGTALHEWTIQSDPIGKSKRIAELMGFKGALESEVLDYLRSVNDLVALNKNTLRVLTEDERRRGLPMPFKPCIERETINAILSKPPLELMNQQNLIDIPVMMGYNSEEGIAGLVDVYKNFDLYDKDISRMIPRSLNIPNESPIEPESKKLGELIRRFYVGGQKITGKHLKEMAKLLSDYHFVIGAHLTAEIHARRQPNSSLYFYRFAYDGEFNLFKKLLTLRLKEVETVKGACHGDEMFYLFNTKFVEIERSEKAISTRISREMCKMWTNFAKYGNPTPSNDTTLSVKWSPLKTPRDDEEFVLDFLEIDEKTQMLSDPDKDRIEFWKQLYQKWNGSFLKPKL